MEELTPILLQKRFQAEDITNVKHCMKYGPY